MKQHLKTHLDLKNLHCEKCDKSFSHLSNLNRHLLTHQAARPFKCSLCDKTFSQSSSLKKHVKVTHESFSVQCHLCDKSFASFDSIRKHFRRQHDLSKEQIKDAIVTAKKKNHNVLEEMVDDVSPNEEIYTETIEQEASNEDSGQLSQGNDASIHPFVCDVCSKSFRYKASLTQHLGIHSEKAKMFHCDICKISFSWQSTLVRHLWSNHNISNQESIACNHCSKSFKNNSSLQVKNLIKC